MSSRERVLSCNVVVERERLRRDQNDVNIYFDAFPPLAIRCSLYGGAPLIDFVYVSSSFCYTGCAESNTSPISWEGSEQEHGGGHGIWSLPAWMRAVAHGRFPGLPIYGPGYPPCYTYRSLLRSVRHFFVIFFFFRAEKGSRAVVSIPVVSSLCFRKRDRNNFSAYFPSTVRR
jgi:hypothetical protein